MFAIYSSQDCVRVWHWLLKRLCPCLALIVYMIVWVFDIDSEELFNWLALIPSKPTIGIELYLDCYKPELLLWSRAFTIRIEQLRVLLKRKFHHKLIKSYTLAAGMLIYLSNTIDKIYCFVHNILICLLFQIFYGLWRSNAQFKLSEFSNFALISYFSRSNT